MKRWFAALLGSIALIACGIVHGYWTGRWSPPVDSAKAAERLDTIPLGLGEWDGEALEVKAGEAGKGVAGFIKRRYVHRKTGATVELFLVCGQSGPVSIHSPDACYGASGFRLNAQTRYEANSGDSMWTMDATRTNATDETRLRVYWAWSDGSNWTASSNPRVQFARRPVLHKLYLVRELSGGSESRQSEPCEEFMQALLPVLKRTLFAPS